MNEELFEIIGEPSFEVFRNYFAFLANELLSAPNSFKTNLNWREDYFNGQVCLVTDVAKIVPMKIAEENLINMNMDIYDINFLQNFFPDWKGNSFEIYEEGWDELDAIVKEFGENLNLMSGYHFDNPVNLYPDLKGRLTKFRFFTTIRSDEFWISVIINKSNFDSGDWHIHPEIWKNVVQSEYLCSKCKKIFTINLLHQFNDDEFLCHECYCKYKCKFSEECSLTNKEKMELLLGKLELEFIESGFKFSGNEFNDIRKDGDCYASFYILKNGQKYLCEISVIFFEIDSKKLQKTGDYPEES